MDHPLLILDCNYICFRSMLRMSGLSYEQKPTGVIFGFLKQIQSLANKFQNAQFVFTWDSERSYRREIYPEYKRRPSKDNPELAQLLHVSRPQFREIRCSVLPRLGFKNIFLQTGIEADDIIAMIIKTYWANLGEVMVIVSADNDLYQLLAPEVIMYDPKDKSTYTEEDLIKEKKITASGWYIVKAIAGCTSDNIKGVKGVGEINAIKYVRGELKGKKLEDIKNFYPDGYNFNVALVRLPYIATRPVVLQNDELDIKEFEKLCLDYGFHSLLGKEAYSKWKNILKN